VDADGVPGRAFTVPGLPMSRAPARLRPYLDTVDGAVLTVNRRMRDPDQPTGWAEIEEWQLQRAGEAVGLVTLRLPE